MKYILLIGIAFLFLFLNNNCNTTEPGTNNGNSIDTTSHNFTFQTWTFGEHSSSALYDVAIIDDNNIWVVGEIYLNDSTGQPDPQPYAVAHWNGTEWKLMKVSYHDYNQTVKYPGPLFSITSIYGEIYSVSYANLLKWTGTDWIEKAFFIKQIPFEGQVLKIWGNDENNIICVGRNGAIYKYFGSDWEKIESGTTLDIYDIWGNKTNNSDYEILCIASDQFGGSGRKILQIKNDVVDSISNTGLSSSLNAVWFVAGKKYYIGGDGLFSTEALGNNWVCNTELPAYYKTSVRGNNINDVFVAGAYGLLLHYNGKSWMNYQRIFPLNGSFGRVDIKGDIVCAVGNDNNQAVIVIGRR